MDVTAPQDGQLPSVIWKTVGCPSSHYPFKITSKRLPPQPSVGAESSRLSSNAAPDPLPCHSSPYVLQAPDKGKKLIIKPDHKTLLTLEDSD